MINSIGIFVNYFTTSSSNIYWESFASKRSSLHLDTSFQALQVPSTATFYPLCLPHHEEDPGQERSSKNDAKMSDINYYIRKSHIPQALPPMPAC